MKKSFWCVMAYFAKYLAKTFLVMENETLSGVFIGIAARLEELKGEIK